MDVKHYDGTKLLSLSDINNKPPELYVCAGNRTGGKTVYFNRLLINQFKKRGDKFCLIFRHAYEVDGSEDSFFKDIKDLFFTGDKMRGHNCDSGIFRELYLNDKLCGYSLSLKKAGPIKRVSHTFKGVKRALFDEIQTEDNSYLPGELSKLLSVHTSMARGDGQPVRHLPFYLVGNKISLLNPYYNALGISKRLKSDTNYLRGDGWVFENYFNSTVADLQSGSGMVRAMGGIGYANALKEDVYLNDDMSMIGRPQGRGRYLCTIVFDKKEYGITIHYGDNIVYASDVADTTYPTKIAVTSGDISDVAFGADHYKSTLTMLRSYFTGGYFRFKNLTCKDAVLTALKY